MGRPECIAAICNQLSLEKLYLGYENCSTLTSAVVDMILRSPTAQSLSFACIMDLPAIAPGDVLRLARGCPKLVDLCWYLDGLTPLTDGAGQDVDDLTELLESRAAESKGPTYYEVDEVFQDFGPWKANSYHYKNYPTSQHPSGP